MSKDRDKSPDFTTPLLIQLYFELEEARRLRSGKMVENEIKQEIEEVLKEGKKNE